ncbi:MAG: caspase family protein, partial [Chloroflexaceae bacterium]|nr:caspase family protein [Chloroflexaceae bacterium]
IHTYKTGDTTRFFGSTQVTGDVEVTILEGLAYAFHMDAAGIRSGFFDGMSKGIGDIGWYNADFSNQSCQSFVDTSAIKHTAVLIAKTSGTDMLIPFVKENNRYVVDFEVFALFSMFVTASDLYNIGIQAKEANKPQAALAFFELVGRLEEPYRRLMKLLVRHSLVQMMVTPQRKSELQDQDGFFALAKVEIDRINTPQITSINTGRFRALLVGVSLYEDQHISNLPFCENDVNSLRDQLLPHYDIVRTLTEGSAEGAPNRANILSELDNLAQSSNEDDLLLFYFSGHGATFNGEGYLLPKDTKASSFRFTGIAIREIGYILRTCVARAKVFVIDSCHAGATIGKADNTMTQGFLERVFIEAEGSAILASCKNEQKSYFWTEKQASVYTHYFIEAVSGSADFDQKGFTTVNDINRYVTDNVKTWALQHGVSQTPTLQYTVVGDIIICLYKKLNS